MVNSKYDAYFLYYCARRELSLTSRAKNLDVSCSFFIIIIIIIIIIILHLHLQRTVRAILL